MTKSVVARTVGTGDGSDLGASRHEVHRPQRSRSAAGAVVTGVRCGGKRFRFPFP